MRKMFLILPIVTLLAVIYITLDQMQFVPKYPGLHRDNDIFLIPTDGKTKVRMDEGKRAEKVMTSFQKSPFHYYAPPDERVDIKCPPSQIAVFYHIDGDPKFGVVLCADDQRENHWRT